MNRILAAWRASALEQRRLAIAALGLFVSMFLPWYSKTTVKIGDVKAAQTSLTAFQAFSFVEAAVLLVPPQLRQNLARFLRSGLPGLHVLAWNEIPDNRKVRLVTAVGK